MAALGANLYLSRASSWPLWVPILPPSCPSLGQLGPTWGQVGLLLHPPGPSWCPSCPLSAPSWGKLGQTWACLEPFGAYLAHPGPSSGQLTASLCFYLAVVDWQQCSQRACAVSARKWHLRNLQNLNNFAIGTTVSNSIARRCLFSTPCKWLDLKAFTRPGTSCLCRNFFNSWVPASTA